MYLTSFINDVKIAHLYIPTSASSATWQTNLVVKDYFLPQINQQIPRYEISVFEKIYDVVYKVCTFKFEKLRIFIAFPLPSINLIWRLNESDDLSFLLHSSM